MLKPLDVKCPECGAEPGASCRGPKITVTPLLSADRRRFGAAAVMSKGPIEDRKPHGARIGAARHASRDPWVVCTVAAKDVTAEWLTEATKSGAYCRTEPNGDVIVKYRASQLEKRPN